MEIYNPLPAVAPDNLQYAYYRYQDFKQTDKYKTLKVAEELGKNYLKEKKEEIIGDYGLRDIIIRTTSAINPLFAALVPTQEQVRDSVDKLKEQVRIINPYIEEQTYYEKQQTDILDELANLQEESVRKLDNLENILTTQESKIKETKLEPDFVPKSDSNLQQNQPVIITESKNKNDNDIKEDIQEVIKATPIKVEIAEPKTDQVPQVNVPKDVDIIAQTTQQQTKYVDEILEELRHIRANLESVNSFLTGSQQFGLSGLIDRIFNKYTVFLNKHPAFRGIHAALSFLTKVKLGLTKPANVKQITSSIIKRFLGIDQDEGPLQQLVKIAAAQADIQYNIYKMLKDYTKKSYELSDETKEYFSSLEPDIIDQKIDKIYNYITNLPPIAKLLELKVKTQNKAKEKIDTVINYAKENVSNSNAIKHTINLQSIWDKQKKENITNIIENTKQAISSAQEKTNRLDLAKVLPISKISTIKQNLPKVRLPSINTEAIDKAFKPLNIIENKVENVAEKYIPTITKSVGKYIPESVKQNQYLIALQQKRQLAGQKLQETPGQLTVGLTSIVNPLAPSLIHFSTGNYGLAAKELLYAVPIIGQLYTAKTVYEFAKENKDLIKNPKSIKEKIPNFELSKIKQFSVIPESLLNKIKTNSNITSNKDNKLFDITDIIEKTKTYYEKNAKVSAWTKLKDKYALVDAFARIPIVKAIEGIFERKLTKVAWGLFGTVMPLAYAPIEITKFLANRLTGVLGVKGIYRQFISPVIKAITNTISDGFSFVAKSIYEGFRVTGSILTNSIKGGFKLISASIGTAWTTVVSTPIKMLQVLVGKKSLSEAILELGNKYNKQIKKIISINENVVNVLKTIKKSTENISKNFLDFIKWQKLIQIGKLALNSIKSTFSTIGDIASNFLGSKFLRKRFGFLGKLGSKILPKAPSLTTVGANGINAIKIGERALHSTVPLSGIASATGLLSKGVRLLKVAGPIGAMLTVLTSGYDAFTGWNEANKIFNVKHATTSQKVIASLSSVLSGLTFGLLDKQSVAKNIAEFFGVYNPNEAKNIKTAYDIRMQNSLADANNTYMQNQTIDKEYTSKVITNSINKQMEEFNKYRKENQEVIKHIANENKQVITSLTSNPVNVIQNTLHPKDDDTIDNLFKSSPGFLKP